MSIREKLLNKTNAAFVAFMALGFALPSQEGSRSLFAYGLAAALQLLFWARLALCRGDGGGGRGSDKARVTGDVVFLCLLLLFAWEAATAKFALLDHFLYPAPGEVAALFIEDFPNLISGLLSSLKILGTGYVLAVLTGVPLGLVVGWNRRLYQVAKPVTKMLGAIPPIVYIPYAIAILPTFRSASVFIIFIGSFWPIFINTLNGVFDVDRRLIDSARAINVSPADMLTRVILPGTIPSIMSGATIGLSFSFILLTSAEMIGATNGMGWYVKYFSDFANYPKVIVGIVFIGLVVSVITFFFERLERYLLRWR
ncbi:MAG: ABC transporter permease [Clostridiales Family XIII bacterium]|nr:ABC transporter permease [Clostridiales Family XIII bacterium]